MVMDPSRLIAKGSPFELLDAQLDGVTLKVFKHAPKTLLELYQKARRGDAQEFLLCGHRRFTYGEIFERAITVSQLLVERYGAGCGTRIAVILDNLPEWVIGFIAATSLGATAVTVHKQSCETAVLAAIAAAECSVVICQSDVARLLNNAGDTRPILLVGDSNVCIEGANVVAFPSCVRGADEKCRLDGRTVQAEQLGLIAFTSGSTGQPKGVELTHRSILCGLMNMLLGGALASLESNGVKRDLRRAAPVSLVVAPFSHISGYSNLLMAMYLGGRIATVERWDSAAVLKLMKAESVTSLVGATPEMVRELLRADGVSESAGSLRAVVVHGTALHKNLVGEIRAALPNVVVGSGYGMTETNGSVCVASETILRERPTTSGRPLPTVDLRIVREDRSDAVPNEFGEIWVRGAMTMRGYCNNPRATQQALEGGWLKTGDIGRLDSEGFLYITDRFSQMVVCGGARISCAAIEAAVLDNGLAEEAAAFGVDDAAQGKRVVLALAPRAAEPIDYARLDEALVRAGCARTATPQILCLPSLPRTVSGKIDRGALRRSIDVSAPQCSTNQEKLCRPRVV